MLVLCFSNKLMTLAMTTIGMEGAPDGNHEGLFWPAPDTQCATLKHARFITPLPFPFCNRFLQEPDLRVMLNKTSMSWVFLCIAMYSSLYIYKTGIAELFYTMTETYYDRVWVWWPTERRETWWDRFGLCCCVERGKPLQVAFEVTLGVIS